MPLALALAALCLPAAASVGPDIAQQLGGRLTPLGAERAGNAAGTIPAWDGGLTPDRKPAGDRAGARYLDPYADDKPLFVITRENLAQYAGPLSAGEQALFARYPDSYRLPIYPSRRSAAAPPAFYAGTLRNATQTYLDKPEGTPQRAVAGLPFPIPHDGAEAIWNVRLRYRGEGREGDYLQAAVSPQGDVEWLRLALRARYETLDSLVRKKGEGVLTYEQRAVLQPAALAGAVKLVEERLLAPPLAWQLSPGQPRIEATSDAGGDTPALGAAGLLDEDQFEGFSGSPARYAWKLEGKRELYVPYNAYRLHDAAQAADLIGAHFLNPQLTRYELHRVWVLKARCRPEAVCKYPRRTYYLDEDSWQPLLAEDYDAADRLVIVHEIHTFAAYDAPQLLTAVETIYDLDSGRYLATGMNNGLPEWRLAAVPREVFAPYAAVDWARRLRSQLRE
ncbi:MAG: DUF1329 domain-containing protein [Nevskia sp.]|nr:DUF1329 domain-containing protein [Nevskia sp.]